MNNKILLRTPSQRQLAACLFALMISACFCTRAGAETQQSFASPEEAATGLVQALQKGDAATLTACSNLSPRKAKSGSVR